MTKKESGDLMKNLPFKADEIEETIKKVKAYCNDELDCDIGAFDAQFLIEYIAKEIGSYYYNEGLRDAEAIVSNGVESIKQQLFEKEELM